MATRKMMPSKRLECPHCGKIMPPSKWLGRTVNNVTYHCPKCEKKLHLEDLIPRKP